MLDDETLLWLLGGWTLAYCAIHSWLASLTCKRRLIGRWPGLETRYRLLYNLLSTVLLLPAGWLLWLYQGDPLWRWSGVGFWLAQGVGALALLGFLVSLRLYDLGDFLGLAAWRDGAAREGSRRAGEALRISAFHRYVRHPWYCCGLLMLWTRELNGAELLAVVLVTLYLVVGSRLEERKLVLTYGEAYRRYCERVPGLLPWPGRCLSREEARVLEAEAGGYLRANNSSA